MTVYYSPLTPLTRASQAWMGQSKQN